MSPSLLHAASAAPAVEVPSGELVSAGQRRLVLVFHPDREVREAYCRLLESGAQLAAPVPNAATAMRLLRELEACGTDAVLVAPVTKGPAPEQEPRQVADRRLDDAAPSHPAAPQVVSIAPRSHAAPPPAEVAPATGVSAEGAGPVHVCSWCKRVRRPDGSWLAAHLHFGTRRPASLAETAKHGICPDCYRAMVGGPGSGEH